MRPHAAADRSRSVTVRHSACATGTTAAATIATDVRIDFSACLRPQIVGSAVIGRPGRAQVAVYAALGVVLLLLGVKSLRAGGTEPAGIGGGPGFTVASEPVGAGGPGPGGGSGDVVVHVAGAVGEPGVYRFPAGARVADAVERAGGPSDRALPDGINLAARLADGQQVVVPERVPATGAVPALAGEADEGPISLGSATIADLETIDGIGPVTAGDIIAFRDEHGGIAAISELDAVPGIGPATIESLSERLQP